MPIDTSQLAVLLTRGRIKPVIEQLLSLTRGTSYEEQAILLSAQFHQQKTMIASEEDKQIAKIRLIRSAKGLLDEIEEDITGELKGRTLSISSSESTPQSTSPPPPQVVNNITNIYTETYVQGNMTVNQQQIQQHIEPLQQLVEIVGGVPEEEQEEGFFISHEEYKELIEILEEIQETKEPTKRQQRGWKAPLQKLVRVGQNFVGARLEKGADSLLAEWIKKKGLEKVMEYASNLV
ncbi:MAG: hypothetical protein AAF399_18635 [Bacteroidota bacterium]